MTDEQIIKRFRKREKILGVWSAERGYDAWDIFIKKEKWCQLSAVTTTPLKDMLRNYPTANIDWDTVTARKLT